MAACIPVAALVLALGGLAFHARCGCGVGALALGAVAATALVVCFCAAVPLVQATRDGSDGLRSRAPSLTSECRWVVHAAYTIT
jgi:hypothetical protein